MSPLPPFALGYGLEDTLYFLIVMNGSLIGERREKRNISLSNCTEKGRTQSRFPLELPRTRCWLSEIDCSTKQHIFKAPEQKRILWIRQMINRNRVNGCPWLERSPGCPRGIDLCDYDNDGDEDMIRVGSLSLSAPTASDNPNVVLHK